MAAPSTPTLIHKVLSLIQAHNIRALLMGGQACVLYGAAEFSKDFDFVLVLDPDNIERFKRFIGEIQGLIRKR